MVDIPSTVPLQIIAGTTVKFSREFPDYPASNGWGYKFFLVGVQIDPEEIIGEEDGAGFSIEIPADDTAEFAPGQYQWVERVDKDGEVYEVGRGALQVLPDLAEATAGDYRSHARRVLAAIEAVLEHRATLDQQSYEIGGRSLVRTDLKDLLALRDRYVQMVAIEENQGGASSRMIGIRFRHA